MSSLSSLSLDDFISQKMETNRKLGEESTEEDHLIEI